MGLGAICLRWLQPFETERLVVIGSARAEAVGSNVGVTGSFSLVLGQLEM